MGKEETNLNSIITVDGYIDRDVAYLLGMIMIRGEFQIRDSVRRLLIHFPFNLLEVKGIPNSNKNYLNTRKEIKLSLEEVRERINELLEVNIQLIEKKHEIILKSEFAKETLAWRDLITLCDHKQNYTEFLIPEIIFQVPEDIQKEFIRGIADAGSMPSHSDRDQGGLERIVIQFNNLNWKLPIQVCKMLQENLNVNVQHILWGHPNMRASNIRDKSWAKEHRLRVYAEDFAKVGYNFSYKQEILNEMIEVNKQKEHVSKPCNPKIKKIRKPKPKNQEENSSKLPSCLRGKHFDAYFQICQELGCEQGEKSPQIDFFTEEDEI